MTFSIVQVSPDRERLLTAPVRHFTVCGILQERSLSGNNESLKVALVRTAMIRVANVAFLKPDLKILACFEHLWLFWKLKKARQNLAFSGFFSVGKAWLWKNIV